uniref:Thioredoxin domain-containing protein n=1 Tax=Chromera velia CCMP2878 TaxID=1169474 RepID=A0A0G4GID0_9ALVE|mmetsp:Transcript_20912/g.41702  ORF Transcript_20912/g.41702 Transcript_20912/m.41702 type:complete len:499 (+) Transcript_20912:253-1749(+)|eukprot:Cvel_21960.t1-p1 / transcript=Cvel_21960.t1 / gene=Cvel_21960 / organism=Chromera_velia_CCMP2878 / gene_product=Protein disulfide isomerase-like 1-4, putative / transcript_product=Protein disulfide isomerase-like 1-4, putative / location=Cvel_scaffold2110:5806-8734(-) / protein_length=498 / sequence_SO=supercontig / SO=protein_coding / is_pseudo=false
MTTPSTRRHLSPVKPDHFDCESPAVRDDESSPGSHTQAQSSRFGASAPKGSLAFADKVRNTSEEMFGVPLSIKKVQQIAAVVFISLLLVGSLFFFFSGHSRRRERHHSSGGGESHGHHHNSHHGSGRDTKVHPPEVKFFEWKKDTEAVIKAHWAKRMMLLFHEDNHSSETHEAIEALRKTADTFADKPILHIHVTKDNMGPFHFFLGDEPDRHLPYVVIVEPDHGFRKYLLTRDFKEPGDVQTSHAYQQSHGGELPHDPHHPNHGGHVGAEGDPHSSTDSGSASAPSESGEAEAEDLSIKAPEGDHHHVWLENPAEESLITESSLRDFESSYWGGTLSPWLRSEAPLAFEEDEGGLEGSSHGGGKVIALVGSEFEEKVMKSEDDVVVFFYAPWCGHCQKFSKKFADLAERLHNVHTVKFYKMDATKNDVDHPEVSIQRVPYVRLFPSGGKHQPVEINHGRQDIVAHGVDVLQKHCGVPFDLEKADADAQAVGSSAIEL